MELQRFGMQISKLLPPAHVCVRRGAALCSSVADVDTRGAVMCRDVQRLKLLPPAHVSVRRGVAFCSGVAAVQEALTSPRDPRILCEHRQDKARETRGMQGRMTFEILDPAFMD
eukprot:1160756-Pelagomonas_calceolata.AAC.4